MRFRRLRPFILVLVVAAAFVLMILDTVGFLAPVEGVAQTALTPFAKTFTELRTAASSLIQTARDLRTLRQRNSELEALIERLTVENLQLSEVAAENERLRSFFQFAQTNPTYDFRGGQIIARVIGNSASPYVNTIQIDLGRSHGIEAGMPVVTDRGVVGRVLNVFPESSDLLLLGDPSSSINVMTQASRAPGSLRGRPGQLPIMEFIPPDVNVSPGEIVITSGLAGAFPKGLVVGQVVEVLRNDNLAFQQAIVRPTVDFDRIELALVITNFPPETAPEASPTPAP